MKKTIIAALSGTLLTLAMPVNAHHSFADYDDQNRMTVQGTLKKVRFRNPHIRLKVDVEQDGKVTEWEFSGPSPIDWRRAGWKKSDLEVDTQVTITGFPKRDGSHHLSINVLKNAEGKVFGQEVY